ncbi:RRP15-like protein [Chanos chanos]|uniref:RRP15-like protein n=1 Tax=Chanos chanos TaxID=29144 RepID=A0A6J2W818_CHACN|nr:RRP15-like protein [Chanos chanos]
MAASVEEPHVTVEAQTDEDDGSSHADSDVAEATGDEESEGEQEDSGVSDGEEAGDAEDEEEQNEEEEEEEAASSNAGWADAMAKILQKKTPDSKPSILLKNKELDKIREKERKEQMEKQKQLDKKRAWEMMCRVKPDVARDREYERNLQRIATRGVVQLFNAVKKHQKNVGDMVKEAGGSERKKAKILSSISKKDFISVLRGTESGGEAVAKVDKPKTLKQEDEKPAWSVLRDDFMMGASMKDWDKESDGEQ